MKEIIVGFILLLFAFGGAYGCVKADFKEVAPGQGIEKVMAGFGVALLGVTGLIAIAKGCNMDLK